MQISETKEIVVPRGESGFDKACDSANHLAHDTLDNFVMIRTPVEEYANKKVRGMGYELNSYRYAVAHAAQVKATEERIRRAKELKATI